MMIFVTSRRIPGPARFVKAWNTRRLVFQNGDCNRMGGVTKQLAFACVATFRLKTLFENFGIVSAFYASFHLRIFLKHGCIYSFTGTPLWKCGTSVVSRISCSLLMVSLVRM
jgi:hypothetical protein